MATRSTITFRERGYEPVVRVRKHFDGYIDGLGHILAEWLIPMKLINGICNVEQYEHDYANGIGCLAAKWIADVKTKTGDIYLDCGCEADEDYNYEVILEPRCLSYDGTPADECITVEVRLYGDSEPIFKGTPSELLEFEEG